MDIVFHDVKPEDMQFIREIFREHCPAPAHEIPRPVGQTPDISTIPMSERAPPAPIVTAKKERKPTGFWRIPFNSKQNTSEYFRALKICRKYEAPYPKALEQWSKDHPKKTEDKEPDPAPVQNDSFTITPGMKVRQLRPDAGRMFEGIAEVTARHGELIKVKDSDGITWRILACHLEPVINGIGTKKAPGATA